KIAGSTLHHTRLGDASALQADHRSDRIAIAFRPNQMEADAQILCLPVLRLVVAEKISGAVIRCEQKIDIAVTIEISAGQSATDFRLTEIGTGLLRYIPKNSFTFIQ